MLNGTWIMEYRCTVVLCDLIAFRGDWTYFRNNGLHIDFQWLEQALAREAPNEIYSICQRRVFGNLTIFDDIALCLLFSRSSETNHHCSSWLLSLALVLVVGGGSSGVGGIDGSPTSLHGPHAVSRCTVGWIQSRDTIRCCACCRCRLFAHVYHTFIHV